MSAESDWIDFSQEGLPTVADLTAHAAMTKGNGSYNPEPDELQGDVLLSPETDEAKGQTDEKAEPKATPAVTGWPAPLDTDALYGLAGDVVRTIEPHSEADPVALLVQSLIVFGNLVGRHAHFTVEADDHFAGLFACLVGQTSKGRKGSSFGHIERLARAADVTWANRVESGLTSGEGLIWAVRDPSEQDDETDGGEADKRLLVVESEFAGVLRALERQGNRLSSVIRDAWDGRTLRTLTRTTSAKATGAHISIIGHITEDELRRYLTRTEIGNGFGNRFLWLCVRRSKALPRGGAMHRVDVAPLVEELRESARFASTLGRVELDAEAGEIWDDVYAEISEGVPGLVGAMTGRAEAQVLRLALVYALLDRHPEIAEPHLRAALALWDYCLRSVEHVFGSTLGDPLADTILDALNRSTPEPLSRTRIRELVGGRVSAEELEQALRLIERRKLARPETEATQGRPREVWRLAGEAR